MDGGLPRSGPFEEDCSLQNEDTSGPVGGRLLTAMMCLCHPVSGLTQLLTGADTFR